MLTSEDLKFLEVSPDFISCQFGQWSKGRAKRFPAGILSSVVLFSVCYIIYSLSIFFFLVSSFLCSAVETERQWKGMCLAFSAPLWKASLCPDWRVDWSENPPLPVRTSVPRLVARHSFLAVRSGMTLTCVLNAIVLKAT